MTLSCNPLAIRSASTALYDIYVGNPYKMTIGNLQSKKVAGVFLCAAASLYTCMLYGATIYMAGRAIVHLGAKSAGEAVKLVGEKIFVVGAVPTYWAVYTVPKKIIATFPDAAYFVAKKIQASVHFIVHNVLVPVWNHAIVPTAQNIDKICRCIYSYTKPVVDAIANKAHEIGKYVLENVIGPLFKHAVLPVLKGLVRGLFHLAIATKSAIDKVALVFAYVLEKALIPAWNALLPVRQQAMQVLTYVAHAANEIIAFVANKALSFGKF